MKRIQTLTAVFVLLGVLLAFSVCAGAAEYSVSRADRQNEIVISGKTRGQELFSVQLLPKEVTPDAVEKELAQGIKSVFAKTLESDANGEFSFYVKLPASGEYVAYIRGASDDAPTAKTFVFTLEAEKEDAIRAVIDRLNRGEELDVPGYLRDFFYADETLMRYFDRFLDSEAQNAYFSSKMKNQGISGYNDLMKKAREAMVLTAARNSDGPANLREIMDTYRSLIGLSSLSDKMSVYTAIKGEYKDIKSLKAAYENAAKTSSQGTGGGSSGGSGNAAGSYASPGIGSVQSGADAASRAIPIHIRFEDLASVEWAYRDISELFDKGIVNGVSEHLFRPNLPIKREEFTKLMVCAMGLGEKEAASAGFTDAEPGAWYEAYLNIAKEYSVANGMGNGLFGVGRSISRQDMAVMIYNAMKQRGYAPSGRVNTFSDRADCAEYANEAIAELCAAGIVSGVGENRFDPHGEATRAQAAVIINRALSYIN